MTRKYQWLVTVLVLAMLTVSFSLSAAFIIPVSTEKRQAENDDVEIGLIVVEHYASDNPNKKHPKDETPKCYATFSFWREQDLPRSYSINPAGSGMSTSEVFSAITAAAETWDDATSTELFDDNPGTTTKAGAIYDGTTTMSFGDYDTPGVIAVCYLWYIQTGKPSTRYMIEFDIMFDTDYTWGDSKAEPDPVMDLQGIATHEIGHGLAMDDIYEDTCSEVTMYGYSWPDDVEKRTLEPADIEGLQKLYGA